MSYPRRGTVACREATALQSPSSRNKPLPKMTKELQRPLMAPADSLMVPADSLMVPADSLMVPADSLMVPADSLMVPADSPAAGLSVAAPVHGPRSTSHFSPANS
jgi:hypothetical protein